MQDHPSPDRVITIQLRLDFTIPESLISDYLDQDPSSASFLSAQDDLVKLIRDQYQGQTNDGQFEQVCEELIHDQLSNPPTP